MIHRIAALGVVALALSCQADTAVSARAECHSDANCSLGQWTVDCCPRCKPYSAPSDDLDEMNQKCGAMSPVSGRCPPLDCPAHEGPGYIAKCVEGRCVVGP